MGPLKRGIYLISGGNDVGGGFGGAGHFIGEPRPKSCVPCIPKMSYCSYRSKDS